MTFDIRVTVELQPSPQLVELLQAMQPRQPPGPEQPMSELKNFMKERKELKRQDLKPQEVPKKPENKPKKFMMHRPVRQILEVPAFSDFTTEQPVHLFKNLYYAESENGLVMIKYLSGTIYTLWSEIMKACRDQTKVKPIPSGKGGNKHTGLNQFIRAVEGGLRKGQAKTQGDHVDPDADFKPQLPPGTIDTSTRCDGGKLEGLLEG